MKAITVTDAPLADEIAAFFNLDYRLVADPYPLYKRIRQEAPVFRHTDKVLISRYEDVREVLSSPLVHQGLAVKGTRFRTAAAQVDDDDRRRLAETFGFFEKRVGGANGEHHLRLRRLAQKAFTPRMVAQMEQQIAVVADRLIAAVPRGEPVEFIEAYAFQLPLIVICEMLDISPDDRDHLRGWANSLGRFVGADWRDPAVIAAGHESVFNLREYLTSVFEARKFGSSSDLLGALIAAEADGDRFTEDELVAMITQFVFAGHETSTMFLGNALVSLLGEHRDVWDELCSDPALVPAAVEELLRFDSPTHNIDKLAAEDLEIGGVGIREGDTINVMIASANYDEGAFDNPETLDIHREAVQHVTFGRGPHHCLGASLARLEAQVSLHMLTQRFPQMRLATDEIEWRLTHMNRGPETLPVVLGPERA
ncbi:MAG TPA: cytochrome P450 [Jatrophihabitantaceae bacterium]